MKLRPHDSPANRLQWTVALGAALVLAGQAQAAVNLAFGSHPMTYAAAAIRPDHLSQAALDQAVRDAYDAWKARLVREKCGTGRYVVLAGVSSGNLTVSEAHGYGMMATALMAGHDPDARRIFDGMYAYFLEHPSVFTPGLMAWNQNRACGDVAGGDSASDGDLDIAYALLLADKQWGSCGPIDYLAEARRVIAAVKAGDLDATAQYVKLGDWATSGDPYYDSTRTSDFMPDHYRSFEAATADAVWAGLLDRTYEIAASIQATHSPATGLLPDFVVAPLTSPAPAPPNFLEGPLDGAYSYNAARDPLRLGTDFIVSGDTRARTVLQKINSWVRGAAGDDPANIKGSYRLDGTFRPADDYLTMAFVAPLGVGAMVDVSNQAWLNAIWDLVAAYPPEDYFEDTLKLLSMIVMSGNWWAPQAVLPPACAPDVTALCTNGGYLSGMKAKIGGTNGLPGRQRLVWSAKLFFPQGIPVAALDGGAQVLVQDAGSGDAAVYELSTFTDPIPAASDPACDPARDIWRARPTRTVYRNRSTSVDAPVCTPGSARGLKRVTYRFHSARDLSLGLVARGTAIAAPVGPLRFTYVLGNTAAAGAAGACAVSAPIACTARSSSAVCRGT